MKKTTVNLFKTRMHEKLKYFEFVVFEKQNDFEKFIFINRLRNGGGELSRFVLNLIYYLFICQKLALIESLFFFFCYGRKCVYQISVRCSETKICSIANLVISAELFSICTFLENMFSQG